MSIRVRAKTASIWACLLMAPVWAFGEGIEDAIRDLQRQIDELKAQQQAQQRQVQEVKQASQQATEAPTAAATEPKVTFGGQYRVNFYTAEVLAKYPLSLRERVGVRGSIRITF